MSEIQEWIDKDPQHCAWCSAPARGDAWHNDYKLHPSCGQIGHGEGWVPEMKGKTETARPLPTREEIADVILAESLFGSRTPIAAADAVLALLKGQDDLNPSDSMGIEHEENNDD